MVAAVELARAGSPEEMVASLGWLALDLDQAGHLLVQANSVVRKLLLSGDTDMARTAAAMVPGGFFTNSYFRGSYKTCMCNMYFNFRDILHRTINFTFRDSQMSRHTIDMI